MPVLFSQADRNVLIGGEEDLPHGDRLKRLLGNLPEHGGGVQPDLGALGRGISRARRVAIMAEDIVQRGLEIGVAEPFDDDPVDVRNMPIDRLRAVHSHDRADPYRGVERGPEMELVRSVRAPLGGDDATQ
jgi:hypothetical protein